MSSEGSEFDEDKLLVRALGEVGGRGRRGAEAGARRLRKDVFETELVLRMSPADAAERARDAISDHGSLLDLEGAGDDRGFVIAGIVGAGVGNLNPAVVIVTISASAEGSRLVIRGAAKEGLIKQRAGEKAARRVAAALASDS
jgi:hypothetical protein